MAAPVSSDWACVAVRDFDKREPGLPVPANVTPLLSINAGTECFSSEQRGDFALVHAVIDDKEVRGWVPKRNLRRGKERHVPLPIFLPAQWGTNITNVGRPSTDNRLHDTLRVLWENIYANRNKLAEQLPMLSEGCRTILFNPGAAHYGDAVYRCITPEARKIMASGRFDPRELCKLDPVSSTWPVHPGVYIIVYKNFGGQRFGAIQYETANYIGQTVNFQTRDAKHKTDTGTKTRSNHYRIASKTDQQNDRRMIPIVFEQGGDLPESFLNIAEFTMICLFHSWSPLLFTPSDINLVGAYAPDFDAAQVFSQVMKETARTTGWEPTVAFGLNWNTPFVRNDNIPRKWISWYDEKNKSYFYRTKRTIQNTASGNCVSFAWGGHERVTIPTCIQNNAKFKHGQLVDVVVEILKDSGGSYRSHPFRYVRFPSIGRNRELEKLNSLAVKLEWVCPDDNQWYGAYLDREKEWTVLKTAGADGNLSIHHMGLMMMMDLEEIAYTNPPAWLPRRANAAVWFLRYNHLKQQMEAERVQPKVLTWPADNTLQQNIQRIRDCFKNNELNQTWFGVRPRMDSGRKSCDICLSLTTTSNCRFNVQTGTCQNCSRLHRVCTFTPGNRMNVNFLQGAILEELGVAVNASHSENVVMRLKEPPYGANSAEY